MVNQPDTIYQTLWLLLHDEEFLRQHANIKTEVFPRGSLRYLTGLTLNNWKLHQQLLTSAVVALATDGQSSALRRAAADPQKVRGVYTDLSQAYFVEDDELPMVRKYCHEWLERRHMLVSMEKATDSLATGQLTDARVHLSSAQLQTDEPGERLRLNAKTPDFLQAVRQPKPGAVSTGFKEFDDAWEGGSRPGELGIVAGHTGVGKSMILCYMASHAFWAGCSAVYYTFELTPEQIQERIVLAMLEKGKNAVTQSWDVELTQAARRKGFKQGPPPAELDIRGGSKTWNGILSDLEQDKREFGKYPDFLFLDSADDVAALTKRDQIWQQLRETYTFLRAQAQDKNMRVWTTGQLNRGAVEKARVNLKDIGDSFAKVQRSHYCIGIAQTEQELTHVDGPFASLFVLKDSLHGSTGTRLECATEFGRGTGGFPGYDTSRRMKRPQI